VEEEEEERDLINDLETRGPLFPEEEEEERSLIADLKRHTQLAVAWNRRGSLVPGWT